MTVSQVARAAKPPRHAQFRQNAFFNNAPLLFKEMEEEAERAITGLPSFLLIHGHQSLDFAHIGLPHSTKRRFLYRAPNLLRVPHVVDTEETAAEAIDVEAVVTLKDEIQKWQIDNNV